MERPAGMPRQPLAHLWMFVGRIIVDDGVDHFSHRDLLLDRIEEADELLVAMVLQGVLSEGGIIVESDGLAQRGFDPSEHRQHDRNGLSCGLSGEPGGERHAGFALMKNEHRPCALTNDGSPSQWPPSVLPSTVLGRSWMETRSLMVSCEGLDRRGRRRL